MMMMMTMMMTRIAAASDDMRLQRKHEQKESTYYSEVVENVAATSEFRTRPPRTNEYLKKMLNDGSGSVNIRQGRAFAHLGFN